MAGLKTRIVLIAAGAMLFATGTMVAVNAYFFSREYVAAIQSRSLAIATSLQVQLERLLQPGVPEESLIGFDAQVQETAGDYEGVDYAMVVAPNGRILYHSNPERRGAKVDEPEVLRMVRKAVQANIYHKHGRHDADYAAIVPVFGAGGIHEGSVVVDVPSHLIADKVDRMAAWSAGLGLLFMALGTTALLVTLSALVTTPLERLITNLQTLRRHATDLSRRVEVPRMKEMGRLAETFNELMDDLQRTTVSKSQLEYRASHDVLTGLSNRILARHRINDAMAYARRYDRRMTVAFIDLDNFKEINDSLGHDLGDILLKTIAGRLSQCVRDVDTVARFGGDEFVVVLFDQPAEHGDAGPLMARLQYTVTRPLVLNGREHIVTASIGYAIFPEDGADAETLLRNADEAMYRAKKRGRNNFQPYARMSRSPRRRRPVARSNLHKALDNDQLTLLYQPHLNLRTGTIVAAEALLRWRHPTRGLLAPDAFITEAEESGLIVPIGAYVLRTACAQAMVWQAANLPTLRVSVNLSPRQFWHADLVPQLVQALEETGLDPRWLELELTESLIMRSVETAAVTMKSVRALGVGFAIDDFGTGYSSLAALKRFPVARLKVAQQFVATLPDDADSATIARAVIALGHSMKLSVVAEGVETLNQLRFLQAADCDEIQGFLISRPLPGEALPGLVQAPPHYALT